MAKQGSVGGSAEESLRNTKRGIRPIKELEEDVYALAKQRMREAYDRFDHIIISFSGGKDSTAVLNIALEVAHERPEWEAKHLPLRTVFYDEEALATETEEYVRRVSQRDDVALEWYCLPVEHRNAASRKSPYWYPWDPEMKDLWVRAMPPEGITELDGFKVWPKEERRSIPNTNSLLSPPELGNVGMVLGIRAQESLTRQRALRMRDHDNWIIPPSESPRNMWKLYPVYDWRTEDVWTAPAKLGWDYNKHYDTMEMLGISHGQQRCSPAFGEEPLGGLWKWAECNPEIWDKMVDRVPGVGAALRYARTELYGFGGMPVKAVGVPWTEYLTSFVAKYPDDTQKMLLTKLQDNLSLHYRKTLDPILVKSPHPISGISWNYLLRIAMRGDFKGRNQPHMKIMLGEDGRPLPKYWIKYVDEYREIMASGLAAELNHTGEFRHPDDVMPIYVKEQS